MLGYWQAPLSAMLEDSSVRAMSASGRRCGSRGGRTRPVLYAMPLKRVRSSRLHPANIFHELLNTFTTQLNLTLVVLEDMARGVEGNEISTPRPPTLKKSTSSSQPEKNQKTLLGFFQKSSQTPSAASQASENSSQTATELPKSKAKKTRVPTGSSVSLTPAPSSDAPEASSPETTLQHRDRKEPKEDQENGLPSPITPADEKADVIPSKGRGVSSFYSPSRKV